MRQLSIPANMLADARLHALACCARCSLPDAVGLVVWLWLHTRKKDMQVRLAAGEVQALLPATTKRPKAYEALVESGYIRDDGSGSCEIVDNAPYFALRDKLQVAGRRGGYRAHKAQRAPSRRKAQGIKTKAPTSEAWDAYRQAYQDRYGVEPLRNGTVNAQMAALVGAVGAAEAPALAAFYVRHNAAFYVRAQHPVGLLLRDAPGLFTQMRQGVAVTEHDVAAQAHSTRIHSQLQRLGAL